jgi:hypothetical protein
MGAPLYGVGGVSMRRIELVLVFAFACCVACTQPETTSDPMEGSEAVEPAEMGDPASLEAPQPTAEAVWSYLEQADYASNWSLWPGKGQFYEGSEPHGALLTTYLNPAAMEALEGDATSMPAGAMIVKENYSADRQLAAVSVMYKSAGFDAEYNDWFWLSRLADGTVEASGQVESCHECHESEADNDYLMSGDL